MKLTRMHMAMLLGTLLAFPAKPQMKPEVALRAAMETETVKGDLKGAIEQYKKIAQGSDRAIAAKALIRMAECHQKLGDAESRKIYERVVRDYSDQKEAVTVARARLGHTDPSRETGIITRQVWPDAIDTEGAPSPDGRHLTFVDWTTGDLAVRELATGKNRRLTNKGEWRESEDFALYSVFSPDGKQAAYTWFNGKDHSWDIRIVSVGEVSGTPKSRVLYHADEYLLPADWSQDGKQILALFSRADGTHQIALITVADGSARTLKSFDWRAPAKMSLSPDGRYIAYDFPPKEDSPERDIFVLAADASRESALVDHAANDVAPVWTPDGKRIVFASDRTGSMGAWMISVADGKALGSAELIKADIGRVQPMAFTRKGSLFYGLVIGDINIFVASLDLTTGKLREPAKRVSERFTGNHTSPDWSPDGRFLAYLSRRSLGNEPMPFFVSIHSLDTGEQRDLRPDLGYVGGLRWSPDGKTLAAWGSDRKGRKGIYQIDVRNGAVTPLVLTGEDIRNPFWSSDGKSLYYQEFFSSRVVARNLETGSEQELIPRGKTGNWALSRDGQQIGVLLVSPEKKTHSIAVVPASGGALREILTLPDIGGQLIEWENDGRGLIFARAGRSELWRVPVEGGKPEKLDVSGKNMRRLRIHPDGQRFAFPSGEVKAEVWVMENLLPTVTGSK